MSDPNFQKAATLRVLLISNLYPPHVMGGAEVACAQLAAWLAAKGHAVAVLTLSPPGDPESVRTESDGVTVFRRHIPNLYHAFEHLRVPFWKKPFWHIVDHFNPVIARKLDEVLSEFRPDVINTHHFQGMGHNVWGAIGRRDLPLLVSLHDLGLKCLRQSMFRHGHDCGTPCVGCVIFSRLRGHFLRQNRRLRIISPSRALAQAVADAIPAHARPVLHLPYPLRFQRRSLQGGTPPKTRLMYAGQVAVHKGVPFLLEVLAALPEKDRFVLTIVGRGSALESLQNKYANQPWVRFTGFVPPAEVGAFMAEADALLVPSLWFENQPLVVLEARSLGLPLVVSDRGGLPELLVDHAFGRILPAGDAIAWTEALVELAGNRELLIRWKEEAARRSREFDPDLLGGRYLEIVRDLVRAQPASGGEGS